MRTFTIVGYPSQNEFYGRYKGNSPKVAGSKAFSELVKMINFNDKEEFIVFVLKEITRNSDHKTYTYIGTRVELNEPIIANINGKNIVFKYKNIIAKYNI